MKLKQWFKTTVDPYRSIPIDDPLVRRAKELIPPEWWGNTWVAGSAATRFGQHGDVDVWIVGVPRTVDPSTVVPNPDGSRAGGDRIAEYEHMALKVYNNPEEKLQIMVCHDDIHRLLDQFDISVHCGATNIVTGEQIRGAGYGERVNIIKYINDKPVLTLTRYLTFAKRYGDFGAMFGETVQKCAAETFYLKTPEQTEQMLKDNYVDRGL